MASTKIKIGYFIDAWNPGAGTENQLLGTLQHLNPERVDVRLFTLREPIPAIHQRNIPWPIECLGVTRLVSLGSLFRFFRLVRRLRRERFDIVMVYFLDTNLFVVPACRLTGVKACVVNRRDMGYWHEPGILSRINRVNRWADYFLVNSQAVKETVVVHEHFPRERIEVIYNGLWDRDLTPPAPLTRADLGVPDNAPLVGIVANLRPVKRIDRFIDMAALVAERFPSAHYVIAGRGELEPEMRQRVERLNLADKVHFLGQVPVVRRLLPLLEVGVLTSESEGFSNALIEYVSAGIPAVTFDVGGNPEIVRDGVNGQLVPEGDLDALAAAVLSLLQDKPLRDRLAEQGPTMAAVQFDPEQIMKKTMEFYETLVRTPRRKARFG